MKYLKAYLARCWTKLSHVCHSQLSTNPAYLRPEALTEIQDRNEALSLAVPKATALQLYADKILFSSLEFIIAARYKLIDYKR
jgi:hypothetical protein